MKKEGECSNGCRFSLWQLLWNSKELHGFEEGGKTSGICGKGHRQKSGFLGRYDLGGIQGVF